MKRIDVQEQPVLSPGRIFQIAVTGVKYRLFRAVVTVAVIVVAMAFLMNILTESLIKRAVAESVRDQIEEMHRVDRWIARLSMPQTAEEILEGLAEEVRRTLPDEPADEEVEAALQDASPYLRELTAMSGYGMDEILALQPVAREAIQYLRFFDNLDYGRRRVLVGPVESTQIFDRLQSERAWHHFTSNLADMRTVRFPFPLEEFQAFIERWDELETLVSKVRDGQSRAIAAIQATLGEQPVVEALRDADGAFGDTLREAGFALTPETASLLAVEVERLDYTLLIEGTINIHGVRQAVAARRDILPGDVTMQMIWQMLRSREGAEWFIGVMHESELATRGLTAERLEEIASQRAHARLLAIAERQTREAGGGLMGIGTRMTWLAFVSMLVCAVGIANAMLMSVTERFREIATLKCLGALDAFIMSVFLIEAALLGLVGGLGGALAGLLLATTRMAVTFRSLLWPALPWAEILIAGLISLAVGIVLAAISAVYPSFRAARLAPMEAMRIE